MANFEQGIGSGVFQLLDPASDIVSNRVTTVSSGIWSSGGTTLTSVDERLVPNTGGGDCLSFLLA